MCGIVGVWGGLVDKQVVIEASCRRIHHRGPDSNGYWADEPAGLALGHVRLAIQDLTEAGHQPMTSACGRYVLVLNGEIYNHLDLRKRLDDQGRAPAWRGHSDTETVLAGFVAWGVHETLQAATGMFALALWDRQTRRLVLARDRMGEKPLYMGYAGSNFVFASELKALVGIPGFNKDIDRRALSLLMRHNYIPAPFSIYRGIGKLEPGTWLELSEQDLQRRSVPDAKIWWSALQVSQYAQESPLAFESDLQAVDALEAVLGQAVRGQMISDVELGAFLSGGVDSSMVVALMQKHNAQAVRTFSIGFDDPAFNEAEYAKAVAAHLGTLHTELYVSAADALDVVPSLPELYDEPFADSSQIPTALVTRMTRQHVTVALSGDGGDELFGGYSRYVRAQQWWNRRQAVPAGLRGPLAAVARAGVGILAPGHRRDQLDKLSEVLGAAHEGEFYRQFVSYWKDPAQVVIGAELPSTPFDAPSRLGLFERMMLLDALTYLPDDILVKVDRAAMAASLETRVPMLDHHVFEFAQRLPSSYKRRGGQGKWLLRQVLYRHVPAHMIDRPKKGFSVPMAAWLRGPLKDWGAALLDPVRLKREGLFHAEPIVQKWSEHQSGKRNWSTHLWGVLMTQAWLDGTAESDTRPL
ncbi:asparagine synthase (glutamine-hydrolyzing) [Pollutimonas harenae]|uniref:asparagine synthase (glutamine-hydrolyzing) n=1 Tax=Pollutimonas harenae TaxID=657015 RepID=A0A853GXM3_9BURK|nr:asparagine synthase (glutamine-hydrolyzing) [Pollutimonas harenae]NYT86897.1 asparagine synthase (glutamine-hydrolyzing) [Pollutimonas harenae]TEA69388.1 asparagine synthase (glutamine-hydrolyzing) [Pollutimonas harenae]